MSRASWFWGFSLRSKLGFAALVGLITTAVLAGLLLQTACAALDLVSGAQKMNQWVKVNTNLLSASRDYQGASYREVREPGPAPKAALAASRLRFERLLGEVARLPIKDESDRQTIELIGHKSRIVLEHFSHSRALVATVDRKWHEGGMGPALIEVARITAPATELERVLRSTIGRGHGKAVAATERAKSLINFAAVASIVGMILAVGFSAIVLLLLETRLRPGLQNLEEGVHAFRSGQLGRRIVPRGDDELARLSIAFNAMAATIEEKHKALRDVQEGLEKTVADRTSELQHAYAKLSDMDERRRAFLADVSHELRTPLTIIRGEAQVALRMADRPGEDPHETLERIVEQTRDLSCMVDELLLLALADVGGLPLERTLCDVQEIVARAASDFDVVVSDMGGSIVALNGPTTHAMVDRDKLRRVLATLIENALRHCPPGVNIVLDVSAQGEQALVAVCDDGPGIDPGATRQLFQRFRRGTTAGEGSGLGLHLARALVEAHDGEITLHTRPEGGTRVLLSLPLYCAEMEAA